jgi:hypothetical protein
MKNLMITLFFCLSITPIASAHRVGNGGDYLRGTFLSLGQKIIKYLEEDFSGRSLVAEKHLDLKKLKTTLNTESIIVTNEILIDNTQSLVDAIGIPGLITINERAWYEHFERNRDIYYLVFHEMLRSADINDDNYIISRNIYPFPTTFSQTTRLTTLDSLIPEDSIKDFFKIKHLQMAGEGCRGDLGDVMIDFDDEKNILNLSPRLFKLGDLKKTRLLCALSLPLAMPKNKKLLIGLVDVFGDVHLNEEDLAKIHFNVFFSGTKGNTNSRFFQKQKTNGPFILRSNGLLESSCGADTILRFNSSIFLNGNSSQSNIRVKDISLYLSVVDC